MRGGGEAEAEERGDNWQLKNQHFYDCEGEKFECVKGVEGVESEISKIPSRCPASLA
jgi:hypothetical protein